MDSTRETKEQVSNQIRNGADKAKTMVRDATDRVRDFATRYDWDDVQSQAEQMLAQPVKLIRRHPFYAVAGAVAFGYVLGAIGKRRSSY